MSKEACSNEEYEQIKSELENLKAEKGELERNNRILSQLSQERLIRINSLEIEVISYKDAISQSQTENNK